MSELWQVSLVILWIVTLFMAFLLAGALRQIGLLLLRLGADPGLLVTRDGLDRGKLAPDFQGAEAVSGQTIALTSLPKRARAIAFLSDSCVSCRELVPHLNPDPPIFRVG